MGLFVPGTRQCFIGVGQVVVGSLYLWGAAVAALDFRSPHAVEKSQWRWTVDEFLPHKVSQFGRMF